MSFSIGATTPEMGPRGALDRFGSGEGEGQLFNRRVVARMLSYLRPYSLQMGFAFILMLVESALTLLIPYLLKIAIDQNIAGL